MQTHPLPPPDLDCIMQDVKLLLLNLQWFRVLGASFLRFKGLRFRDFGVFVFDLGCFVFKFWVLCFQDLVASFSRFGCFVLRSLKLGF